MDVRRNVMTRIPLSICRPTYSLRPNTAGLNKQFCQGIVCFIRRDEQFTTMRSKDSGNFANQIGVCWVDVNTMLITEGHCCCLL